MVHYISGVRLDLLCRDTHSCTIFKAIGINEEKEIRVPNSQHTVTSQPE